MKRRSRTLALAAVLSVLGVTGAAVSPQTAAAAAAAAYERRVVDIPMRDGAKLHTVIGLPQGAHGAPILLDRTPFGAERRLKPGARTLADALPAGFSTMAARGYIVVFQDVRGKGGSGGEYVVQQPLIGDENPSGADPSTDAWDTIDWLVKHTPESNGRVGLIGTSYEGFMVAMGLIHPHPALKAAVAINPLIDGWTGDDWFHNGAFRQVMIPFVNFDSLRPGEGPKRLPGGADDYRTLLEAGSAGAYARRAGIADLPEWRMLEAHPAFDGFWEDRAADRVLGAQPPATPVMWVGALWDQEDSYGAVAGYEATKAAARTEDLLVLGPWSHGQANGDGARLGPLEWGEDTAREFRERMLQPFLDEHLMDGAPKADLAPVTAWETGAKRWMRHASWPVSCAEGCVSKAKPLYLEPSHGLGFAPPAPAEGETFDAYVSDPGNPVPYRARPVKLVTDIDESWPVWMLEDQRKVSARPDVLTYQTAALSAPLELAGHPVANLFASTSGTDADWVVKLVDVYPDDDPKMGGHQLAVSMEIFRGRYRKDPAHPAPVPVGAVEPYRFALPSVSHVFLPGHRIMVQIQSSWFPLYDRNPQTFVGDIFTAAPGDYRSATQKLFHAGAQASFIELPVVEARPPGG